MRRMLTPLMVLAALALVSVAVLRNPASRRQDFLTPEERFWLNAHDQRLTVAPDPRWMPDRAVEDQQIYQGIISDFLTLIERKLGVRFMRLYAQSWEQVLEAEKRGEIDIHPVLFKSDARSDDWLFTEPYMRIPVIAVIRASKREGVTEKDLARMRMGIGHGYGIETFMREYGGDFNLVPVESDRFGLIKAAMGEIDIMVTDLASASYYIEKEGLTNLRLAATLGSLYEFSLASRADKPILNTILNKTLQQISREDRRRIYDRWIVFDVQPFYQDRSFWYTAGIVLLALAVLLAVVIVWNATLKLEVAIKTRALQKAHDELEQRVDERTGQLAEVNRALQREIAERAAMAADILHISGNERARIGRDLHDSIGQQMVGIVFLCQALESRLRADLPREAEAAARIASQMTLLIRDMKRIVKGLLPVDVMDKGLLAALEQLAHETTEHHGLECRFVCVNEDACRFPDIAMATNLYRIVQEAIANAVKHARGARHIEIGLEIKDGVGCLEISDDGAGIPSRPSTTGMGLKIMRYRAALSGGSVSVQPGESGGTIVVCRFNPDAVLDENLE